MKLTLKLLAAMLSVCMVLALLVPAASAADLSAGYSTASYYDIAVTTYSRMVAFQNGVVPAANASRQYGLIDPTGKVVLPFQYAYVWALDGGLFGVATGAGSYGSLTGLGIVNSSGKVVLAPSEDCTDISCLNSTIRVSTRNGDKYYTTSMAPSTQEAYEGGPAAGPMAQYDWYYSVGSYYLACQYGSGWNLDQTVLDSSYKVVIPLGTYSNIEIVSDGASTVFVVDSKDGKTGVLDTALKTVVPFGTYDTIYAHYNGGGTLNVSTGSQNGAISLDGKVLVPLGDYSETGGLNEDGYISAISADGSSSTLFKDGKAVKTYAGKQVTTEVYYRSLAFSTTGGETYGMMDVNEKVILKEQYDSIMVDGNGYLKPLTIQGWEYLCGLYTQDGQQVFPDTYPEITYLTDGKYRLNDGTYYGVSKVTGAAATAVIPMKYLEMRTYTYQFIELYDGSKYSIVDLSNNVVVPESSADIEVFAGSMKESTDIWSALDRLESCGELYDGYTDSVLPFIIQTGGTYATVYADYQAGTANGRLPCRASNINEDGWFVYQGNNGWYGFGRIGNGFLDVAPDTWYTKEVDWAVENGIVNGTKDNYFSPNDSCIQQDILLMIWRSKGEPESTVTAPVSVSEYAAAAVNWAYEQKMIDDSFVGKTPCTRAQAVEFLWKAAGTPTAPSAGFTDVSASASYAMAVNWAYQKKITTGESSTSLIFNPNAVCQRSTIVTFLYRAQD